MKWRLLLRIFFIQALWNYRTLLGSGLAWTLLPALREFRGPERDELRSAISRHAEHFNAHPYLAGFAVGALAGMERDDVDEEVIRRFREVVRGPLGSLGDRLIWSAWLPTCVLLSGGMVLLGASPLAGVAVFLMVYNLLHLTLRWWGITAGLALGRGVGEALGRARLPVWSDRVGRAGVLLLGLVAGLVLATGMRPPEAALHTGPTGLFVGAGILLFIVGVRRDQRAWWWTPALALGGVAGVYLWGILGA